MIIRNVGGDFVAASSGHLHWHTSLTLVEALAIRMGILLGLELGLLHSVILESDSQMVINMLNGLVVVSQEVVFVHDIKSLASGF